MIIKSMGRRKSTKAGQHLFQTLYEYLLHEHDTEEKKTRATIDIEHNIYEGLNHQERIDLFIQNAEYLRRHKGANLGYHEILSLRATDHDREQVKTALKEITRIYLRERAPDNIAVAMIHEDKDHLHAHIMLSANPLFHDKRLSLTKSEFLAIQEKVSSIARTRFPELNIENLYTEEKIQSKKDERIRTTHREQERTKREKAQNHEQTKPNRKATLASELHNLFEQYPDQKSFESVLKDRGYSVYTRGQNMGIIDAEGKRHRFQTLGIEAHFEAWQGRQKYSEKQYPKAKNDFLQDKAKINPDTPKEPGAKFTKPSLDDELDKRMNDLKTAREQGKARDDEAER
jgi:hypothetical protein